MFQTECIPVFEFREREREIWESHVYRCEPKLGGSRWWEGGE